MKLKQRLTKKQDLPQRERIVVAAGACPVCKNDKHSQIYDTKGQSRYCKCNNCGETWKKVGPLANQLVDLALETVELLADGDIVKPDGGTVEVVLIDVRAATELANRIVASLP